MKVRATRLGYYNHRRRREGEVFKLLSENAFSSKWMEKVDDGTSQQKPKADVKTDVVEQTSSEEVI